MPEVMVAPPRQIQQGSRGPDVRALKRALKRAGSLPQDTKVTNVFDPATSAAVRAFQKAKGLDVDGQVGPNTFRALFPLYDAMGQSLVAQQAKLLAPSTVRQKIGAAAHLGYVNRDQIHYTQSGSRMQGVRERIFPPQFPTNEDCSSFATWCYFAADAPDPNGLGYNGEGYTGTQAQHGQVTTNPRLGDLVFYGGSTAVPAHVAVFVGDGKVVSHGQESGPGLYPIDYRSDRGQVRTYLP